MELESKKDLLFLLHFLWEGKSIMNKNAPTTINHNLELETSSTKLYFAQFNKCKNKRYSDITADPLI